MRPLRATILLLMTACADFTLVDPFPNEETSLTIFLRQREDTVAQVGISGFFVLGTSGSDHTVVIEDSTLTVDGVPVASRVVRERALRYDWSGSFEDPGALPASLHLRGPTLAETPEAGPAFALLLPRRRQPFRMDLVAGQDLVLDASNAPINAERVSAQFSVRITRDGQTVLTTQAQTALPDSLRVPWAWLADRVTPGDSLDVSVLRLEDYELDTAQYRTSVFAFCEFLWRVRITASASSAS